MSNLVEVKIPTNANPFTVTVNGKKYSYPAGETVMVPFEVAEVIEQIARGPNLPPSSGGGSGGGAGGGADVLNDAGIIKQEHLPEGYPYPLKSGGAILPETSPVLNEEMGAFVIMDGIDASMFTEGESYTVNWNGTEYKTSALAANDDGMEAIILGDAGALQGVPVSGEPFMIMILSAEAQAAMGVASMIMPVDGSTTVLLSISTAEDIMQIDRKFLPEGYPVYVDIYATVGDSVGIEVSESKLDSKEIFMLARTGQNVVIRLHTDEANPLAFIVFRLMSLSTTDAAFVSTDTDGNNFIYKMLNASFLQFHYHKYNIQW